MLHLVTGDAETLQYCSIIPECFCAFSLPMWVIQFWRDCTDTHISEFDFKGYSLKHLSIDLKAEVTEIQLYMLKGKLIKETAFKFTPKNMKGKRQLTLMKKTGIEYWCAEAV